MQKSIIREIREACGMTQEEFARVAGRSTPMIRLYEKGAIPPREVIEAIKSLAVERGLVDLAAALDEWQVDRVLYPPGQASVTGKPRPGSKKWHEMLDEVLDSGQPDAIQAVESNLHVFVQTVRLRRPKKIREKSG
jgi:transcriptional regulator with XRE-family HTH domain